MNGTDFAIFNQTKSHTPEEYRTPIEPIYNYGFRCKWCNVQIYNPKVSKGSVSYCYKCGQAYDCATLWSRIKRG